MTSIVGVDESITLLLSTMDVVGAGVGLLTTGDGDGDVGLLTTGDGDGDVGLLTTGDGDGVGLLTTG
ncbi:hypothetical protein AB0756_23325, partial [Tolypothrix campylonemoides VB511288_2]